MRNIFERFLSKNGTNSPAPASTQMRDVPLQLRSLRRILDCYVEAIFPIFNEDSASLKRKFLDQMKDGQSLDSEALLKFFKGFRERESEYVILSLKTLRNAIWKFVRTLGQEVIFEGTKQEEFSVIEGNLKSALVNSDPQEWKKAIENALVALTAHSRNRKSYFEQKMAALRGEVSSIFQELEKVKQGLDLDGLTKIFNRKAFDEHIERAFSLNTLLGKPLCLLMIDIDHFKKVNDTYGHRKGDEVLKAVAKLTLDHFFAKSDFVARYGGEEICVVVEGETLTDTSNRVLQYLKALRALELNGDGNKISITASVGVGQLGRKESTSQLIERVDVALYKAKNTGRDRLCVA